MFRFQEWSGGLNIPNSQIAGVKFHSAEVIQSFNLFTRYKEQKTNALSHPVRVLDVSKCCFESTFCYELSNEINLMFFS